MHSLEDVLEEVVRLLTSRIITSLRELTHDWYRQRPLDILKPPIRYDLWLIVEAANGTLDREYYDEARGAIQSLCELMCSYDWCSYYTIPEHFSNTKIGAAIREANDRLRKYPSEF
jgi:hypothetical protein